MTGESSGTVYVVASVVRAEEKELLRRGEALGVRAVPLLTEDLFLTQKATYPAGSVFLIRTPGYFAATQIRRGPGVPRLCHPERAPADQFVRPEGADRLLAGAGRPSGHPVGHAVLGQSGRRR